MRIVLIARENEGHGPSGKDVRRAIEAAGHRVVARLGPKDDLDEVSAAEADLVAVAGGDGAVRRAAVSAAELALPLAIVPLGTANNIATSLGIAGDLARLVQAWERATRVPVDVGVARGPAEKRRFLESAGAGLVARGIAAMDAEEPHAEEDDPAAMLRKARRRYGEVLEGMGARRCRLRLDGEETVRDLLLVEVLNVRSVGPRLAFAPVTTRSDGLFDVVTAEEEHRADLIRHLREREEDAEGEVRFPSLPVRRAARVELEAGDLVHLDDRVYHDMDGPLTLTLERAAVEVLVPPGGGA